MTIISERAYEILAKYRLPIHNKIPAKIATFSQDYFLVGFPTLLANTFDFDKSIFYNEEGKVTFRDVNDYENAAYNRHMAIPSLLYLNIQMEYDVIKTRKGLFFAQSLVEELEKEAITGYVIENGLEVTSMGIDVARYGDDKTVFTILKNGNIEL